MARKSTSSSKKFTTVPPKAKPAVEKTVLIAIPETSKVEAKSAVATAPVASHVTATAVAATPVATTTTVAQAPAVKQEIAPLLTALNDVDADAAREAATALGNLGDTAAVEPLVAILNDNNGYFHSVVRSAAAESLGKLKDRRAIEALLSAVNDPIADTSSEAIRALVTLADPRAIAALVTVVRNDYGFYANSVRRAAVLGLAKLGGDTAQAELRLVAANDYEDSVIQSEAAEAIKSH
jgi:HEAT repeat protein